MLITNNNYYNTLNINEQLSTFLLITLLKQKYSGYNENVFETQTKQIKSLYNIYQTNTKGRVESQKHLITGKTC